MYIILLQDILSSGRWICYYKSVQPFKKYIKKYLLLFSLIGVFTVTFASIFLFFTQQSEHSGSHQFPDNYNKMAASNIKNIQTNSAVLAATASATFTISGNVYVDTNKNGTKDS